MPTLWSQLNTIYPNVLSPDPERSINGTQLFDAVKGRLDGDYAETSIRQHFSEMSRDPTTSIAKLALRHGYYLRPTQDRETVEVAASSNAVTTAAIGTRGEQPEEKFRAIFIRLAERENRFPMHIEHTRASGRTAGINLWKFPDVVLLQWEVVTVQVGREFLSRDVGGCARRCERMALLR